jgi:hypothetical protein
MIPLPEHNDNEALVDVLRQSELSGASRRALLLHTDRLPPALAKPHHLRLAQEALNNLRVADRALFFELSRGRSAVVWRSRAADDVAETLEGLARLVADQPGGKTPTLDELVSLYDLPQQAVWLLDELAEEAPTRPPAPTRKLDVQQLAGLEGALSQADLSQFARWRSVVQIVPAGPPAAALARIETKAVWEERYFAVHAIASGLYPDRGVKADPWLFRRLTRTLDRRMLAMLSVPSDVRGLGALAVSLNVATILGADFLRFDETLPAALRGQVILNLRPADMLADPVAFLFARDFARARQYRLGLVGATLALLELFDLEDAAFDYVQVKLASDIKAAPEKLRGLVPRGTTLVATELDRASDIRWAASQGITLGRGRALAH